MRRVEAQSHMLRLVAPEWGKRRLQMPAIDRLLAAVAVARLDQASMLVLL